MKNKQRGDAELLGILAVMVVGLGLLFAVIMVLGHLYASYQCSNYAQITGKETRFAAFDICYIKTADGWQRWDEYVKRAAASEGLRGLKP